jgi:hypothetical protein
MSLSERTINDILLITLPLSADHRSFPMTSIRIGFEGKSIGSPRSLVCSALSALALRHRRVVGLLYTYI